eukprot:1857668-Pleurochrysis_carterae.AAC.1
MRDQPRSRPTRGVAFPTMKMCKCLAFKPMRQPQAAWFKSRWILTIQLLCTASDVFATCLYRHAQAHRCAHLGM